MYAMTDELTQIGTAGPFPCPPGSEPRGDVQAAANQPVTESYLLEMVEHFDRQAARLEDARTLHQRARIAVCVTLAVHGRRLLRALRAGAQVDVSALVAAYEGENG